MFKRIFIKIKMMNAQHAPKVYFCPKGCCTIKVADYKPSIHRKRRGNCCKAGAFIYDPEEDRVLIVQSRGLLWGCPKGTLEIDKNETSLTCAIREIKEETGIDVQPTDFTRAVKIKNKAMYYYTEIKTHEVFIQTDYEDNDANGITWIKIDCLNDCINSGMISLNQHAKLVFKKFMDRVFPTVEFTKVEPKRRKSSIQS